MKILVLTHAPEGDPGRFLPMLAADGHEWVEVRLDRGEALPGFDGFDALWVMGGVMDVWQEAEYPWLIAEKALIREAVVARGAPYFGICLGHQLLADALGGIVGPAARAEVGLFDVARAGAGGLLDGLPATFPCLQWHGAEVKTPPEGALTLALSSDCPVQAMSWGPRAHSAQFHAELEEARLLRWAAAPDLSAAAKAAFGPDPATTIRGFFAAEAALADLAARLYANWMRSALA